MRIFNFRRTRGASLVEVGLLLGLIALLLITTISDVGQTLSRLFGSTANTLTNATAGLPISTPSDPTPEPEPDPTYASCKEWSDAADANFTNNGVNEIYPNGASTPINVYCQGAMTLILAQYENDPVTNWNEGIQADYDPTLATQKGFALSSSDIPSHSKIYFGLNLASPLLCLSATYSTGDLAAWNGSTALTYTDCDIPANHYFIFRSASSYYGSHNPDGTLGTNIADWSNTLSVELHNTASTNNTGSNYNWAFSPNHEDAAHRGYSYNGADWQTSSQSAAWTVWVE